MRALNLLRRSESSAFDALFLCNVDQPHLRFDQTARYVSIYRLFHSERYDALNACSPLPDCKYRGRLS